MTCTATGCATPTADGIHLCDPGHTRTGVAKLRRAIRAARGGD